MKDRGMVMSQQRVTAGCNGAGAFWEPKESEKVRLPKEPLGHVHKGKKTLRMSQMDEEEREGAINYDCHLCA